MLRLVHFLVGSFIWACLVSLGALSIVALIYAVA
jgi:hypothetical protein